MSAEEQQMRQVLDLTKPLDVALFDRVAASLAAHDSPCTQQSAVRVMEEFKAHPEAWRVADQVLKGSEQLAAKYVALQTLDHTIQTAWHALPEEQRTGVRNFVVNMIMELATTTDSLTRNKALIEKMNFTLVQIVKKDWPERWPSFISEIVSSAAKRDALMQNNLAIIRLLSEEVFDFSKGKMTQKQIGRRKEALNSEFASIFSMLDHCLRNKQDVSLICEALHCLLSCLSWIPLGYIFETKLIELLVQRFLPVDVTRSPACKCLTEIAALTIDLQGPNAAAYQSQIMGLFAGFLEVLKQVIPAAPGLLHEQVVVSFYDSQDPRNADFVQTVAQFIITIFKQHLVSTIEPLALQDPDVATAIHETHAYLLGISYVDDKEVFKSCVEYWSWISMTVLFTGSAPEQGGWADPARQRRRTLYSLTFTEARKVFVKFMARPEEVIVFEDENGEVIKKIMKDVDAIEHHITMKEGLVYLTHLDSKDTETIMLDKLKIVQAEEPFSPSNLATLSWAIGSISGALTEDRESRFLIAVIRTLLVMCDQHEVQANKASVASDIMYVIGQYPRFLSANWRFLNIVIMKLFEFMQELFEGIQDMACDTFLKISSSSCKVEFVRAQPNAEGTLDEPFILKLLRDMDMYTRLLHTKQVYSFYEATGLMLSAAEPSVREELVPLFMRSPNLAWFEVMNAAGQNQEVLKDVEVMKKLSHSLRCFVCGAVSVGDGFKGQIFHVFNDAMKVYAVYSQLISQEVASKGEQATFTGHVRSMRIVKKYILQLLEEFCKRSSLVDEISHTILPPLLETVLTDYNKSVVNARDAQVVSLMSVLVEKLGRQMDPHVPTVLDAILGVTLDMISANPQDFYEHRNNFFKLLQTLNTHCFEMFLTALQVWRLLTPPPLTFPTPA